MRKSAKEIKFEAMIQEFYDNPIIFSQVILNVNPDAQQQAVIKAFYERKLCSVKSGRGCGKTWLASILIWHFLCTRAFSQVYITAPSGGTLKGAIWPTLNKLYDQMDPIYRDQFEMQSIQVKHKMHGATWFALTRTARQENAESLAGSHAENMLYVIDEASGVGDPMFNSIFGSLTEEDNYLLMLSNPRRLSGFFYDSHQHKARHVYAQCHLSAIYSQFVTKKSISYWKKLYGKDSTQYKIEVLGEFPDKESDSIIAYDKVIRAVDFKLDKKEYEDIPIIWGLDMSQGNDKSVLVKRQGTKVHKDIKKWKFNDTMKVVDKVVDEFKEAKKNKLKPWKIYVDAIGVGKGAYDRLKELDLPVYPAIASKKAVHKKYVYNQKSEWWKEMQDFFRENDGEIDLPDDQDFIDEITGMRTTPSGDGRFRTESKPDFVKRYSHSPDTGEAFSMTFCLRSVKSVGMTT